MDQAKPLSHQQIMNRIYRDIDGFEIPKTDEQYVRQSKGSPIYGEINFQSLKKLIDHLKLRSDDVFVDLGSGVGKVIIQTALMTPVAQSIGIELSEARYRDALVALKNAQVFDKNIKQRCRFINADMLSIDLSHASIIYTCSTAFSQIFMKKVTDHLASFTHPFRVVSLQDLPLSKYFSLTDELRLNMSWVRNTPVYIYSRKT